MVQIQRAGAVLLKKRLVALFEIDRVAPAQRDGVFTPGVVGIERDKGVIEIKQGDFCCHGYSLSSMALIRGMVMARWVCRA